jgi:predicted nuclease with TOPRIM domain
MAKKNSNSKVEIAEVSEIGDMMSKMLEMFNQSTSMIIDQMNKNFAKHAELLHCEVFEMKKQIDELQKENGKMKNENKELRKSQEVLNERLNKMESNSDDLEQEKIKDEVIVTGIFEIQPLTASGFSSMLKKTCNTDIDPSTISKISSFKNKKGLSVVKITLPILGDKIKFLKNKKQMAQKKIFANEALTSSKFHLLMSAKALCKSQMLFSCWSRGGKIFVKKSETSQPEYIKDKAQLDNLFA